MRAVWRSCEDERSAAQAARFGLYWFVFAEVIKILMAAGFADRWNKILKAKS